MMIRIKSNYLMTLCMLAAGWYDLIKEKMVPRGGFSSVPTELIWPTVFLRIRDRPGRVIVPVVLGVAIHCEWRWVRALHTKD